MGVTAVAAAAMAALTGSQAPGLAARAVAPPAGSASDAETPGDTYYFSELPPLRVHNPVPFPSSAPAVPGARSGAGSGFVTERGALPATVLAAYRRAEAALARSAPGCALRWQLLAAVGQVESGQARGGRVDAEGTTYAPIIGPQLNGRGFALIRDTDGGAYDGDPAYDHAVGPMQFIPSTWARWGADGNGDGRADPHNVHDAALAAARYLCAGGRDLSVPGDLDRAILSYNRSRAYLRVVLAWYGYYRGGHQVVPDAGGTGSGTDSGTGTGSGTSTGARTGPRTGAPSPSPSPSSAAPSPTRSPSRPAEPEPPASSSPTPKPSPSAPKPLPSRVTVPDVGLPTGGVPTEPDGLPGNV
ncbi:lytic transglycosylase domain-containing protein [Streptomyces sp. NPDC015346]|uniref:lytic transglycosylase domain-containing protein n=1 Tax=Streptomyces sp. NPDC015346 TaxID=3364954 RepID=UPI0037007FE2